MNARYYVPGIGRFASADTIVPAPASPQSFNRYSYVGNNPLNGTDPDGHCYPVCTAAIGAGIGGVIGGGVQLFQNYRAGVPLTTDLGKAVAVGAVAGAVSGVTFGAGTAVLGTGFAATVASGAVSGAVAGQAAIATTNVWDRQAITSGLGNPSDIARDALIGGVFAGVGYGANRAITNWRLTRQNLVQEVDPRIKLALLELEKSGLRPGQTEIYQGKILRLVENFDSAQAHSIVYKSVSGTNYLVDGHHTSVASTIVQKSGIGMGQRALLPPEARNVYWTKRWWELGKKTIQIYR